MKIRAYRKTDFETLYAIDQACYSPAIAYTRTEMQWYLSLRSAECWVAEARKTKGSRTKVTGFVIAMNRNAHGHVITIDVVETYRRMGVGSALLHRAELRMKRRGVAEVWLETATNNEAAIAFWEKHGYRNVGRLKKYYPDGLDAFAMSKELVTLPVEKNTEEK